MIKEFVEQTVKVMADAENVMRAAAGVLSAIVGTNCLAIRDYGVQVGDEAWVAAQDGAYFVERSCDADFQWEVRCEKDGVLFFSIMSDERYKELQNV